MGLILFGMNLVDKALVWHDKRFPVETFTWKSKEEKEYDMARALGYRPAEDITAVFGVDVLPVTFPEFATRIGEATGRVYQKIERPFTTIMNEIIKQVDIYGSKVLEFRPADLGINPQAVMERLRDMQEHGLQCLLTGRELVFLPPDKSPSYCKAPLNPRAGWI